MLDDHYGLSARPFQLTPDPRFWFDTATHKKAMAYLGYGLSQGEGFIVITGDPGAGKTTLVGHLTDGIDAERLNVIKIVTTQIRPDDLLQLVAAGLGVEAGGLPKASMLQAIERGLHAVARAGRRTLLIVDEAQALPIESLEELRLLSNFQAGGYPLLQIFLLGQPEFRALLQDPRLEQLRQRVIAMHHLAPMGPEEVESYIIHRLTVVGWRGRPRFTNDALTAMYRWSDGMPRRLNMLASRALLFGAIEGIDCFTGADLAAVITDLDNDTPVRITPSAMREEPAVEPLPMSSPPLVEAAGPAPVEPAPIQPEPVASEPVPEPTPWQPAEPEVFQPEPIHSEPQPIAAAVAETDPAILARLTSLEARLEEQDAALRRVLTLLVDWVETGDVANRPSLASVRGAAA